jgi:hypothetical protein
VTIHHHTENEVVIGFLSEVCGKVDVWVCGCVGMWVCRCVGV